jgi:hypothetical protein
MARYAEERGGRLIAGMETNRLSDAVHEKLLAGGLAERVQIGNRDLLEIHSSPREKASGAAQAELPLTPPVGPTQIGEDLTPKRRTEIRTEPETDDAVLRDLDRLRANKDIMVPYGETVDARGERVPLMRSVDDVLTEIESREKAAAEIRTCIVPVEDASQ